MVWNNHYNETHVARKWEKCSGSLQGRPDVCFCMPLSFFISRIMLKSLLTCLSVNENDHFTPNISNQSVIWQIAENASWHRALQGSNNLSPPVSSTASRHLSLVILAVDTQYLCDITSACWSATPQAVLLLR